MEVRAEEVQLDPAVADAARIFHGPPGHLVRLAQPVLGLERPAEVVVRAEGGRMKIVLERDRERSLEQDPRLVRPTGIDAIAALLLSACETTSGRSSSSAMVSARSTYGAARSSSPSG